MQRFFLLLLGLALLACGKSRTTGTVSPLEFAANPVAMAGALCSSDAQLTDLSGSTVTLVSMDALFVDTAGVQARFALNSEQISQIFGSTTVAANGFAKGTMTFDFSSKGLTFPADGSVVLIGTNQSGVTTFTGNLQCGT